MHKITLSHARKIGLFIAAALGLLLLTGCELTIVNLTPGNLPENPSQIYTITARFKRETSAIVPTSVVPRIVIDGQSYTMKPSALGQDIYEFDYQLPAGRDLAYYYFLANYQIQNNNVASPREAYTQKFTLHIARRYVLMPEMHRGPVGARISILGRGFTPQDVVYLDNTPARTVFESGSSISFFVPAVDANRNYQLSVGGAGSGLNAGAFRVDATDVQVSPSALTLRTGGAVSVTFTVGTPAPDGGLLLDVTTDIPQSVIMPEVVVPAGQTSVTVNVQGGQPGTGSLFLKGYGGGTVTIPVTVTQ